MSLDVYLNGESREVDCTCSRCFNQHKRTEIDNLYSDNITHNLNTTAEAAGIYKQLWRPDEIGITTARQLIERLTAGLALLESDPERFKAFDPANGWGDYDGLVQFVRDYLAACKEYPEATVEVSR